MKRQTIIFDDEIVEIVEDYRSRQRPIPDFTSAVRELVKKGAKNGKN